ncbi:MAG: hypothetical protein ACLFXM_05885 [Acidimicrobiia bacterium]
MEGTPVELTTKARSRAHGSDKHAEADDPYELVGVRYPVAPGVDADRELARSFVEEYALLGWTPAHVRMLFETPQFAGAHDIRRRRGPALVDDVLAEVFGPVAQSPAEPDPAATGPASPRPASVDRAASDPAASGHAALERPTADDPEGA